MQVDVKIIKGIPTQQIDHFEDRVVYYTAMSTREYTKNRKGYPHLTGTLEREEISSAITGNNKQYNLLDGVNYAKYVWKMTNVQWTNKSTLPQWYYNAYRQKGAVLTTNAVIRAMKELK